MRLLAKFNAHLAQRRRKRLNDQLIGAAADGRINDVVYYAHKGGDVNAVNVKGDTPLHTATWQGDVRTVSTLLDLGADVRVKSGSGLTAYRMAKTLAQLHETGPAADAANAIAAALQSHKTKILSTIRSRTHH